MDKLKIMNVMADAADKKSKKASMPADGDADDMPKKKVAKKPLPKK